MQFCPEISIWHQLRWDVPRKTAQDLHHWELKAYQISFSIIYKKSEMWIYAKGNATLNKQCPAKQHFKGPLVQSNWEN